MLILYYPYFWHTLFPFSAWLSYHSAFRRQAAAYKLTDWSHMNPELFHFYVSGAGWRIS